MAKVPPSKLPRTTTPRSKGVRAPLEGVTGSVGGGRVQPNLPAAPAETNFAQAVRQFAYGITEAAQLVRYTSERERKAVVVAELNDKAGFVADFDFDAVKPLRGEENSAAMLRTLETMPDFTHLSPDTRGIIYRQLVGAYGRLQRQKSAELMDRMAHEDNNGMTERLSDRTQLEQAIKNFPEHYETNKLELTPDELQEPIVRALRFYVATGDEDGVKLLAPLARKQGLADNAAEAKKAVKVEKKRIAKEAIAAAKADAQNFEDTFVNAIWKEVNEINGAGLTASERQARFQALRDRTAKSQAFVEAKTRTDLDVNIGRAYRREGETDYKLIESFRQRINTVHNGGTDSTLQRDMYDAYNRGAWGPRGDLATTQYNSMATELTSTKRASQMKVVASTRAGLKADLLADRFKREPELWLKFGLKLMFLYEDEITRYLDENPDATDMEIFQYAMEKAAVYRTMKRPQIKEKFDERVKKAKEEAKAPGPPPKEYPDAKWDAKRKMWTVVRDGRLKGVK